MRDAGAFRIPKPRDTWERIDAPKFGGEVFNVDGFKGSHVESGDKTYPVKTSLAVPAGSVDIDIGIEAGAGGGRRARQREMLQDYARNLKIYFLVLVIHWREWHRHYGVCVDS